jgi:hypothetical protein
MHIQARARVKSSTHVDEPTASSEAPFTLSEVLELLASKGFSLRSASGHDIERGGQFSFRVRGQAGTDGDGPAGPDGDEDDRALRAAIKLLRSEHVPVEEVRVFHEDLADEPGALKAFVDRVTAAGYPVIEISIATPNRDRTIPVQIYAGQSLPEGIG